MTQPRARARLQPRVARLQARVAPVCIPDEHGVETHTSAERPHARVLGLGVVLLCAQVAAADVCTDRAVDKDWLHADEA